MSKEKLTVGEQSKPRFEFRSFGQNFSTAAHRMSRLSVPIPEKVWERNSEETYIVSKTNNVNNTIAKAINPAKANTHQLNVVL